MSYILDALKKLEHEKSRRARSGGMINIAGTLFEDERPKHAVPVGRKVALAVAVAMAVTFGATWLIFRPVKVRENKVARTVVPAVPAPAAPTAVPASPVLPAPSQVIATPPLPTAAPPSTPLQKNLPPVRADVRPVPAPAAPAPRPAEAVQASPPAEDAAALITAQELRRRMKERKGQSLPPDQMVAAPADIKLSGIAWQDDRRARRAVINGFLMQEGGMVAGARITDIFQDRVRFSLAGKVFELPLLSSGVPASGK